MGVVSQTHTDPHGHQWRVTVHWATVDGAAVPVGLDLQAFMDKGKPGGVLTAAVLRSLRIGEIIEESRRHNTWTPTAAPRTATPRRATRRGRPAERGDDFVAEVAALYHEAKARGGMPARKPWVYVVEQLQARGVAVTEGQLKNWSRRAKNLGLLTPAGRRKSTKRKETQ